MVAFQHGNIVAKHVVHPIPETAPDLLIIGVERGEILSLRLAAIQLDRATEPRNLWRSSVSRPSPPVPQMAEVKVVGRVVSNSLRGQLGRPGTSLELDSLGGGSRRTFRVAGEETTDINFLIPGTT